MLHVRLETKDGRYVGECDVEFPRSPPDAVILGTRIFIRHNPAEKKLVYREGYAAIAIGNVGPQGASS